MNKFPIGVLYHKVGEYGYFLTRILKKNIIKCKLKIMILVPCHYSLKHYIPNGRPFIVSWGEINFVKNK